MISLFSGPLSEDLRGEISCSKEALCMKTHAACHSTRAKPEKCDVEGGSISTASKYANE